MTTAIATKRAVGYFRVSSTGQVGERHSSLDTQKARFEEYCHRSGLSPVAFLVDIVSGQRDDRKEYLRMLDFVPWVMSLIPGYAKRQIRHKRKGLRAREALDLSLAAEAGIPLCAEGP